MFESKKMKRRNQRTRSRFGCFLLLSVPIIIVIFAACQAATIIPPISSSVFPLTMPEKLTRQDVLPTLTPLAKASLRQIIFPEAHLVSSIVRSVRIGSSWETPYLGDSVGLLDGTSWLNDTGGNIVLIGHVEDTKGQPGPFAHLFQTKAGDIVILRDGDLQILYKVASVERAAPDDMHYVVRDGRRRITLITCTDWDVKTGTYLGRLIVIAKPVKT